MRTCTIDGCENKHYGKGYCIKHYCKYLKYGDANINKYTKKGMWKTRIYRIFSSMKARCYNVNHIHYKRYGGRGIKIDRNTFDDFYKDMGDSYNKHIKENGESNTSIDRINNKLGYNKENCRWATNKQQSRNTRANNLYNGKTIAEWAEELNTPWSTIKRRIVKGQDIGTYLQKKRSK